MKIRMIRLQNIKSYADETINFNSGVNFISGVNGAGKTSIIESIGFALFDSKPGISSEFIRYGQKTGIITVEFEADDGRIYKVVRKTGNTNSWLAYDVETHSELNLHNAADIKPWLKDIFGLSQDQDLTRLFEDIIGVGQGMFTAPFLERPAERKLKFNKMLKVEAYRDAGDNIRSVLHELDDHVASRRELRAEKEGSVKDYDAAVKERDRLIPLLEELSLMFETKKKELAVSFKVRDELRRLEKEIDKTVKDIQLCEIRLTSFKDAAGRLEDALVHAGEALSKVDASKEGYDKFVLAGKEREKLEQERRSRDEIIKQHNTCRQKEAEIRTTITAGRTAADEEEKYVNAEIERIANQKAAVVIGGKAERRLLAEAEKCLTEVDSHNARLPKLEKLVTETDRTKTRVDASLEQLSSIMQKAVYLKQSIGEEPDLRAGLVKLEAAEKEAEGLRGNVKVLEEKIKVLKENREKTKGGRCPFLDAECKNVEGSLELYFNKQLEDTETALSDSKQRLEQKESEILACSNLRKRLSKLDNDRAALDEAESAGKSCLQEIRGMFEALISSHGENIAESVLRHNGDTIFNPNAMSGILKADEFTGELRRCAEECQDAMQSFESSWQLLSLFTADGAGRELTVTGDASEKLFVLTERGYELVNRLKKFQGNIMKVLEARASGHRTALAGYTREFELLTGNEREVQQRVGKLKEKLKALEDKQVELLQVEAAGRELEDALSNYPELDERLKAVQQSMENNREAYDTCMKYQVEAGKINGLENEHADMILHMEGENAAIAAGRQKLDALAPLFSPDLLQDAEKNTESLGRDVTACEGAITERRKDLKEYSLKLASMDKIKLEIEDLNTQIARYGAVKSMLEYIRSVLNRAGEQVAAVYREQLAKEANRLYRDISKENVTLEWKNDYEVILLDMLSGKQRQRCFRQLSGGEQMTAALALRLSFLKQLSGMGLGFFDEPATNLDGERRSNLVQVIPQVTGSFDQLFVISHDDSFDAMTENIIQLKKDNGEGTRLA